jgi:hypothetical protein
LFRNEGFAAALRAPTGSWDAMEKLIYVVTGPVDAIEGRLERIERGVIPVARRVGGERMAILVPDQADLIRTRCPARIGGDFDAISAIFECWIPTVDARAPIEAALASCGRTLWGYLVTESTMAPCPTSSPTADGFPA